MRPRIPALSSFSLALVASFGVANAQTSGPIDATKLLPPPAWTPVLQSTPTNSALASTWSDDFNRPDAATLGADWLVQSGSFGIQTNRGAALAASSQWVQHASASAAYDSGPQQIDFHAAPFAQVMYVALVAGLGAGSDNVFVKVQDNTSDGTYDRLFVYRGINGSPLSTPYFFDLATPIVEGRMTVSFSNGGDTVDIAIDSNFDGTPEEVFAGSGLLSAGMTLGTSFGIGCYNQPRFDNWEVGQPPPVIANFCTAGTTTNGCAATISWTGTPSVTQSSGFDLLTSSVEGQKQGLYFYGINGDVAFPWGLSTGWFCVKTPTQRFALQNSGGVAGQCNGSLSVDFSAFLAANPTALGAPFSAGDQVWLQSWFRDPPSPKTTMLSDGLRFTMQP
jgi:hypothetical protein